MTLNHHVAHPPADLAPVDVHARQTPRHVVLIRAMTERAALAWAATYVTLGALAERGLTLLDCVGLALCVAVLTLATTGAAVAITRDSASLDPGLTEIGVTPLRPEAFRILWAVLGVAVVAVTAWRLL